MRLHPDNYSPETTSVWSFPVRGNWATHTSKYRGNFAPQVARNIIEMYSAPRELVLDPMCGSGTTLIEARLLHRNAIGLDINPEAVNLSKKNIQFEYETQQSQTVELGDARYLTNIAASSVDLILTHPPYLNIIKYSDGKIAEDLSNISNVMKFCDQMEIVAADCTEC